MKKISAILLSLIMIFSLGACGSSASDSSAAETPTPDYVYKPSFTTLASETREYFSPAYYTDDGIYAIGEEIIGSSAPEGAVEEYFGQYDITKSCILFISYDGNITKLQNYSPVEPDVAQDDQYSFECTSYLSSLNINSRGNIIVMEGLYTSYFDEEGIDYDSSDWSDHYVFTQRTIFRELDNTGTELSRTEVTLPDGEYLYSQCVLDSDGNILATKSFEDGSSCIVAYTTSGEEAYEIKSDDYVDSIFSSNDGTCYATSWGNTGMVMKPIDIDVKQLGDGVALPSDAYSIYSGGGDYGLYYTSGNNFYGIDDSSQSVKLFSWLDCDINPSDVGIVGVDDNGLIRTVATSFNSADMTYSIDLVTVEKVPYDPSSEKEELVLATQYLDWDIQNAIVKFNRKNDSVRIVVKDYSELNTEDDYSAGTEKMATEIIAGNVPDIICLSGMPTSQFAAKGILEDLYPYLESDSELDINDYLPNILSAAESDGKLVRTVSSFSLMTVVGASQLVGNDSGWTYDDFNNSLAELQANVEDATPFDLTTTRSEILSTCLSLDMNDFVSWETGEVNFNTEEFYSLLKFAKQFPDEFNWDDYSYVTDSAESRISQGQQMLYRDSIYSSDSLVYLESCFMGVPITFVGYPTNNGSGNILQLDSGYAMTTSCKNKEAAWQFLRELFTEDYYYNYCSYSGFSPIESVFDKTLSEATQVHYQIENGEYVLDEDGNRIPEERSYAIGTLIYTYYALSEDIADSFSQVVKSCNKVANSNDSISKIISDEAEAFFQGQKSAEDVAKLIQSKVNIYVNEQR